MLLHHITYYRTHAQNLLHSRVGIRQKENNRSLYWRSFLVSKSLKQSIHVFTDILRFSTPILRHLSYLLSEL